MRRIGPFQVSDIGLGCMHLSIEGRPEPEQAIRTIHAALDAGITLLDTADAYYRDADEMGHNERLVARALRSYEGPAAEIVIATKGGHRRPGDGTWTLHGQPEELVAAARASRERLEVETIPLWQFHRPDPAVPYAESLQALAVIVDENIARTVGISNASVEQILLAQDILGDRLVSVQNHFSPRHRDSEPELRLCSELGIAFLPYRPLGRPAPADPGTPRDEAYAALSAKYGVSRQRICLAWELALSPVVIPIPGARRPETITDSAAAGSLVLEPSEIRLLSSL